MEQWRQRVKQLQVEIYSIYLSYRDPRVPWYARVFAACLVGYAFSPIDLIPDFIPILGYLDDLIVLPLGIMLAIKLIPRGVMDEHRVHAREIIQSGKPVNRVAGAIIVTIWLLLAELAAYFVTGLL